MATPTLVPLPASLAGRTSHDPELARALAGFEQELQALHGSLLLQAQALQGAQARGGDRSFAQEESGAEATLPLRDLRQAHQQLQATLAQYEAKRRQGILLGRVNEAVQKRILSSSDFLNQFVPGSHCEAFVMAIDIRRSTELRLKARDPQAFASFISSLCQQLAEVVKAHDGVFNQFTGDGILAYFPHFLGGLNSGAEVVNAALECHQVWLEHYRQHRHVFRTVLLDVGLGIGIDHGDLTTVEVAELITVTGEPMVYACRLSGAPAGATYLNQPAYEQIQAHQAGLFQIEETALHVKHEGSTLAYAITAVPAVPAASSAAPGA
jgi:class 3 adenylate cyclase